MLQHNQDAVSGTLSDATPVSVDMRGAALPALVWVRPSSATATVEYTTDGTNWTAWPNGTVSAYAEYVLGAPVLKLRFTKASGTSVAYGIL